MKKFVFISFIAALVAPLFAQDPCSETAKLNASASGAQSWNGTKGATTLGGSGDDAYGVEAWTEAGGSATKLTWYGPNQGGGYAFRAEWTNSTDYLGRFGYFWGTNGKKWSNLGDLCVDYNYTRSANGSGGSYSYIGIYGWTIGSSNSAEYYIVEDWFGTGQQAANNLGNNCQTHGNITVDGKTYQVVTCVRPAGSGCVNCNNQAFGQVFSIRQGMASNPPKCGTISIKKHFEEWIKIATPAQYIYDKTYESKFLVEAQGGTGWFEASYMKFSRTGGCGASDGKFSLTAVASPSDGGSVGTAPTGTRFSPGTSVTLTATPKSGWKFDSWSGDVTGTTSPATVTMNADKSVTAVFKPTEGNTTNLIKNGTFTSTSEWTLNKWQNSAGTFGVSGNVANITGITKPSGDGAANHSLQLVQAGIPLIKGQRYTLTFEAKAASARTIDIVMQMDVDPWTGYYGKDDIALTTSWQTFTYEIEMTEATDENGRIAFNFGSATPDVNIRNVKLTFATGGTSSSSATGSSSSRASSSSATGSSSSRASSSSSSDGTPIIVLHTIPLKFHVRSLNNGTLNIESNSDAVIYLYNTKGNMVQKFNVPTGSIIVKTHVPTGIYIVKNSKTKEKQRVMVR